MSTPPTGSVLPIWPGVAPGSETWTWTEREIVVPSGDRAVRNVATPTLEVFAPTGEPNGTAVIVAPGGAYRFLSIGHEGTDLAHRLAERGVAAFVLRYRLRHTPEDDAATLLLDRELIERVERLPPDAGTRARIGEEADRVRPLAAEDGRQAVRSLREHAGAWGLLPRRIGFIGFSAGAGVAMAAATASDPDVRPDFVAAIYGPKPDGMVVPRDAPELFLAHASDDPVVPASESVAMARAWLAAGRPAELHLFRTGGHGFGTRQQGAASDRWLDLFEAWMHGLGLLG